MTLGKTARTIRLKTEVLGETVLGAELRIGFPLA